MEVKLSLNKNDKGQIDNLIRILAKAKIELQGVEIVAASDAMRWLSFIQKYYDDESKKPTPQPTQEVKSHPVQQPAPQSDKPSKKAK